MKVRLHGSRSTPITRRYAFRSLLFRYFRHPLRSNKGISPAGADTAPGFCVIRADTSRTRSFLKRIQRNASANFGQNDAGTALARREAERSFLLTLHERSFVYLRAPDLKADSTIAMAEIRGSD